ncbi:MAG: prepilin-type N-terminal cleavage/methylation domain-containing protein [Candidatus Omnitrophota bacterium]
MEQRPTHSHNSAEAFTLLEVLIATVIFATGSMAVMWALSIGIFAPSDAENVSLAAYIAQARMEEVRNISFDSLADSPAAPDTDFPNFSASRDVTTLVANQLKRVEVTVSWDVKGGQSNVALTTLVADN